MQDPIQVDLSTPISITESKQSLGSMERWMMKRRMAEKVEDLKRRAYNTSSIRAFARKEEQQFCVLSEELGYDRQTMLQSAILRYSVTNAALAHLIRFGALTAFLCPTFALLHVQRIKMCKPGKSAKYHLENRNIVMQVPKTPEQNYSFDFTAAPCTTLNRK